MAEKTEHPTPKKLRDARKKGQLLSSRDIVSLATLAAVCGALALLWREIFRRFLSVLDTAFALAPTLEPDALAAIFLDAVSVLLFASVLLLLMGALAGVAGNLAQFGFIFTFAKLQRGFQSLNVVGNAKNIFSRKNLFSFLMNILKTAVIILVVAHVFMKRLPDFLYSANCGFSCALEIGVRLLLEAVFLAVVSFVPLAALDYLFQRRFHLRELMMSKDEVKQEYKETEGSPEIKGQRRQIHREVLESQTEARAEDASVVVRNPEHYAVALKYDERETLLPVVVAKGQGVLALRIMRAAERAGVPLWDDVGLAQALFFGVELDNYIGAEHLDAVAEVLIYISELNN
ncbi:MAG: EscU/YscU/HrcU family type III secretion system export apparatus switch protein [Alphaproteobacteria bacterium]|nr:EscU/YscU/HrcU family type III secretion system export apparatus switch protein [Alphaproteobacteria bacterium]MDA7983028.1 EscU/YscU/HrcU family type III secretion system export apparatus switch protein [Alphaproteobacteria bacterium]MDA8000263.1 EscU/YscU/HrcU family type III secretion system export apparatus switch protein [Alphaproteobacteria bacterium]MDA8003516.1 EscU/YscU/HrcU family type III secretion system export apparatus switch protein [Alphaproteobacteria bacterium]MDA8005550.1 